MDCQNAETLLSPYIDGELGFKAQKSLKEHLKSCQNCRTLESLTRKGNQLAAGYVKSLDLTRNFTTNVMEQIKSTPMTTPNHAAAIAFNFIRAAMIALAVYLCYILLPTGFADNFSRPFAGAGLASLGIGLVFIILTGPVATFNHLITKKLCGAFVFAQPRERLAFKLWGLFFATTGFMVNIMIEELFKCPKKIEPSH